MIKDRVVHPGELLRVEFMAMDEISIEQVSEGTGISIERLTSIIDEKIGIDKDDAKALDRFWHITTQEDTESYWFNLQKKYEADLMTLGNTKDLKEESSEAVSVVSRYLPPHEFYPS